MTINTITQKTDPLPGNDSATSFSFSPISIQNADQLEVVKTDSSGVDTGLSRGNGLTNYTVVVASFPGTGSITYPSSGTTNVLATGEFITIKRKVSLLQETDLENEGGYFPDVLEGALDYGRIIDIQQQEEIDRSLKGPVTDEDTIAELPSATERASKYLAFDSNGDPIAATVISTGSATISSFSETLLDDSTAIAWLDTLSPSDQLVLYNSEANDDLETVKSIIFRGQNDIGEDINYGTYSVTIFDASDGTEDGRHVFRIPVGSAGEKEVFRVGGGYRITVFSEDSGATAGPNLELNRLSTSPANADLGGQVIMTMNHDGSVTSINTFQAGNLQIQADDVTEDSEDTHWELQQMIAGVSTEVLSTVGGDLTVINDLNVNGDLVVTGDILDSNGNSFALRDGLATPQSAPASAVPIDFTGITSTATRITIMLSQLSTDGTEEVIIQLGDSGGFETTNYIGGAQNNSGGTAFSSGILITDAGAAADILSGIVVLTLLNPSTNTWAIHGNVAASNRPNSTTISGVKSLSSTLTQIRVTTTGTPDDWDSGSVNILVE